MLFSEEYGITCIGDEDWFDPILHQDTFCSLTLSQYLSQMMICSKIAIQK
jgi:hypothetical protein